MSTARAALLGLVFLGMASSPASAEPIEMKLKPGASSIEFRAEQNVLGTTRGTFKTFTGSFVVDPDNLAATRGTVKIQAKSVSTGDDDRDAHLRRADFFDVKKHPEVLFEILEVEDAADGRPKVVARVTIKGKRTSVAVEPVLEWSKAKDELRVKAVFSVSLKEVGIDYEAPFYVPSIKDRIQLSFDATLVKQ